MFQKKFHRFFFVLGLGLAVSSPSWAEYDSSIVFGPTFSSHAIDAATLSSWSASGVNGSPAMGTGFSFGSFFGFPFSEEWGAEIGVLYVQRITSFQNATFRSTSLSMPILARWAPFSGARGLKIELGPYFGLLPTGNLSSNGSTLASSVAADTVDIGAMGGLSYFLTINSSVQFRLSAFYTYGFVDVNSGSADIRNRGIDIYAGFTFTK